MAHSIGIALMIHFNELLSIPLETKEQLPISESQISA